MEQVWKKSLNTLEEKRHFIFLNCFQMLGILSDDNPIFRCFLAVRNFQNGFKSMNIVHYSLNGGRRIQRILMTIGEKSAPFFHFSNFALFKELLGGIPWARALEGRGVQECWLLFKHLFLHAQERCIPLRKKSSKGGRRPAWLNKDIPAEIRWKRKVH